MEILLIILLGGYIAYDKQDEIKGAINEYSRTESSYNRYSNNNTNDAEPDDIVLVDKSDDCPTEVTEIFYSKASGEITVCKGKLLQPGQETRIVRVNK
jgi:hypothetical protein